MQGFVRKNRHFLKQDKVSISWLNRASSLYDHLTIWCKRSQDKMRPVQVQNTIVLFWLTVKIMFTWSHAETPEQIGATFLFLSVFMLKMWNGQLHKSLNLNLINLNPNFAFLLLILNELYLERAMIHRLLDATVHLNADFTLFVFILFYNSLLYFVTIIFSWSLSIIGYMSWPT